MRSNPVHEFLSLEHYLSAGMAPTGRFVVPHEGVPVDFYYEPVEGARTTVVFFHGAALGSVSLPWHPGRRAMDGVRANRLTVSDPTLALDDSYTLRLSWYVGSTVQPQLQYFIETVFRRVLEVTGIEHVMFFGASGGGFAALEMSRRFPRSIAMVMNPQTSVGRYNIGAVNRYLKLGWDGAKSLDEISPYATHDLVEAYQPVMHHTVAYVQNTRDTMHINNHQIPFLEKVGESPKVFMLMDAWGDPAGTGHVTPPTDIARRITRHLVACNGDWRQRLVQLGFAHQTSAQTVRRAVRRAEARQATTAS